VSNIACAPCLSRQAEDEQRLFDRALEQFRMLLQPMPEPGLRSCGRNDVVNRHLTCSMPLQSVC
jgi:hypothetical protein